MTSMIQQVKKLKTREQSALSNANPKIYDAAAEAKKLDELLQRFNSTDAVVDYLIKYYTLNEDLYVNRIIRYLPRCTFAQASTMKKYLDKNNMKAFKEEVSKYLK